MDGIYFEGGDREERERGEREWEWEWEWNCVVPREVGGEEGEGRGGGECFYEGGERVELPGRGEGRFDGGGGEGGERFKVGVPLMFIVSVRIIERGGGEGEGEGEGRVVAEGRWEKVFSVVGEEEEGEGLKIEESRWVCEGGGEGYLIRFFSEEDSFDSFELFSLWSQV